MLSSWRRLRAAAWAGTMAVLLLGALMAVSQPASASTTTDCTQWGTTSVRGGEYIYQQNEWNSSDTQCVSVDDSTGAWTVTQANLSVPTNGAPATYPSIYKGCHWGACTTGSGLPIQVSQLGSSTTSWSTTQPASGAYDVAYDLWFNSTPTTDDQPDGTEVMIWLNSRGGVQPFGSKTATTNVAGHGWDVWTGQQTSWKIISYVLQGGGTSFSNLDVKALIDDAVARGSINPAHYLIDAEAGFEIWQGGQGLASNSFSFSASQKGSSGGSDTTAPSAPTGLAVSGTTSSSVSLKWTASTDNVGVTGYDVYRGSTKVGSTTSTSYTDSGLSASTSYSYTVKAKDAAGNVSAASSAVTATTAASGGGGTPGTGAVKVQYKNNDSAPGDNQIKPGLKVVNSGSSAVDLSKVTIRYYFTGDSGSSSFTTSCDYAAVGCSNLTQKVVALSSPKAGADHYLEVGFTSGAGSLAAGASTGDIQARINKSDWSNFSESDDYSYATNTAYADATKVTVYVNGSLAGGTEPN
ncbi:Fibronectin type III domain-containing protein [Streptomyces misionensis]|uniref:Fibronectin type III domain-containing protein n=2 Tax=Streptomyces misionensis TaxID=67331 RepID=A0A1H5GX98_9ACTN|nr:Fibronectin type III domain-containing protein [Streptomyces misionensis]